MKNHLACYRETKKYASIHILIGIFISLPQISRGVPSVFDRQCVEFYAFFYAAMYLNA